MMVLIVGCFLFYQTQQPSRGTINVLSSSVLNGEATKDSKLEDTRQEIAKTIEKGKESEIKKAGIGSYDGNHISLQYPNTFELKTKETSESGTLEKLIFLGREVAAKKLTIIISETNTINLEEISGVAARKLNTKRYLEKPIEVDREKGVLFEKMENGFERTAFFLKNKLLTTIALSSPSSFSEDLEREYSTILQSLSWQ